MSKNVTIIGKGAWGKAMEYIMRQNVSVRMVGKGEIVTEDIIVIAVPTNNISELASVLKPSGKHPIIINTAKGIEEKTHRLPREIITELVPGCRYFTLIGPGFATEVLEDMPTMVNLGYGKEDKLAAEIAGLFQTDTFRVRPCEAIQVLELAAALKNIYAIGCGIAEGLGYGANTRALLVTIAHEEMSRLFQAENMVSGSNSTAGTLGDLVLTCNSAESRNFRFGKYLTKFSVSESLRRIAQTVEGYSTLASLEYLEKSAGVTLPFAEFINEVLRRNKPRVVDKMLQKYISSM